MGKTTYKTMGGEIREIPICKYCGKRLDPASDCMVYNYHSDCHLEAEREARRRRDEEASDREMAAHLAGRKPANNRPGVCPKCGTYCYGDCE